LVFPSIVSGRFYIVSTSNLFLEKPEYLSSIDYLYWAEKEIKEDKK